MYHRYIYNFSIFADLCRYFPIDTMLSNHIGVWTDLEMGLRLCNEAGNTITLKGDGVIEFNNNNTITTIDSHSHNFSKKLNELIAKGGW